MTAIVLGSGGGIPSARRETACVLVRDGGHALVLDAGSGIRKLRDKRELLDGVKRLDVLLTHFHYDHVCGLPLLPWFSIESTIWAPGAWLYGRASSAILAPLRQPPISPNDVSITPVLELQEGVQAIGGFAVRASAQPRHWAPSVGLRVEDELAYVTDTPYEPSSVDLARGVRDLLHEAWSSSTAPVYREHDATAADAARVATEAGASRLTLIHLNPDLAEHTALKADASAVFADVVVGEDGLSL
ncbi:MAG TPA: MBL fold metallo-hydrolase [Gaiellaceae bacterium]|nr:MBL fold metallo-hydrolase [Gaiellaceae bacterium]